MFLLALAGCLLCLGGLGPFVPIRGVFLLELQSELPMGL
jgi:hypothetical protein